MTFVVIGLVVVVGVLIVAVAVRRGRSSDDIASFRRQIDALSPEARRPTIDQMNHDDAPSTDEDGHDGDDGDDGS